MLVMHKIKPEKELTDLVMFELIKRHKAHTIRTSRLGYIIDMHTGNKMQIDPLNIVEYQGYYYTRNQIMNYQRMKVNNTYDIKEVLFGKLKLRKILIS